MTYCHVLACWNPALPEEATPEHQGRGYRLCQQHYKQAQEHQLYLNWSCQLVCAVCWDRPVSAPCSLCGKEPRENTEEARRATNKNPPEKAEAIP